jgi:hypothetical protein
MAEPPVLEQSTDLKEVITLDEPLGPHESEKFSARSVFQELYDKNSIHDGASREEPRYIIGRKGAGKTAFLMGATRSDSDVIRITSEAAYENVATLSTRYRKVYDRILSDSLAHAWEVLLYHVAMVAIVSGKMRNSPGGNRLWDYLSNFDDPADPRMERLFAQICAEMAEALEGQGRLSFRDACWSVRPGEMSFEEAAEVMKGMLAEHGAKSVYVVVDNLEELHSKLDQYDDVVKSLFRLVSLSEMHPETNLPFTVRFAFPAELKDHLETMTANSDKDFRNPLTIRWTAAELIVLAGNRLRTFLDLYFPAAWKPMGLPKRHDPTDRIAARRTLEAMLSPQSRNDLRTIEEPIPYLMRHTQLLPRQLIQILNQVIKRAAADAYPGGLPRATSKQLVEGVRSAERDMVKAVFTAYSYDYKDLRKAFVQMKNHLDTVETVSNLHKLWGEARGPVSGYDFDLFLAGCLATGALGVVTEVGKQYVKGEFSYTGDGFLRYKEDSDQVCVHPLFASELFDRHRIIAMANEKGHLPVYPYGSDPDDQDWIER